MLHDGVARRELLLLAAAQKSTLLRQQHDENPVGREGNVGVLKVLEQAARLELELREVDGMEVGVEHPAGVFTCRDFCRLIGRLGIVGVDGGGDGGRLFGLVILQGLFFVPSSCGDDVDLVAAGAATGAATVAFLHLDAMPVGAEDLEARFFGLVGHFLQAFATARFGLFGQSHAEQTLAGNHVVPAQFVGEPAQRRLLFGLFRFCFRRLDLLFSIDRG